jgi:signal transduction histidine kinase
VPEPDRHEVPWAAFLAEAGHADLFRILNETPPGPGYFDSVLMQQALINWLKNAHESGSPPDEDCLSLQSGAEGETMLRVFDRGRGMGEGELTRALLPFYSSKPTGRGLGLPLSNEIVEAHGGRLQLENRPGGGLVVTCRLPGPNQGPPG